MSVLIKSPSVDWLPVKAIEPTLPWYLTHNWEKIWIHTFHIKMNLTNSARIQTQLRFLFLSQLHSLHILQLIAMQQKRFQKMNSRPKMLLSDSHSHISLLNSVGHISFNLDHETKKSKTFHKRTLTLYCECRLVEYLKKKKKKCD